VWCSFWCEAVRRRIALALVKDGRNRMGSSLHVPMQRQSMPVEIVSPVFLDREGARLRG
jgi:sarcosine oxidase subunit alpha